MSDLISREDALNCFPLLMQGELFTVETIRHQLKKLSPAEPQEWISVKDRLPTKNDCYLVTFNFVSNGNPDNGIGVVEFYDGNFYSNGFGVNEDVVAWYIKPVPSPYKGR